MPFETLGKLEGRGVKTRSEHELAPSETELERLTNANVGKTAVGRVVTNGQSATHVDEMPSVSAPRDLISIDPRLKGTPFQRPETKELDDESDSGEFLDKDWQSRALCARLDPEMFTNGHYESDAKKACDRCEVKAQCLEHALEHNESFDIWGGLTAKERKSLKRRGRAR